ncbi:hypothetical protein QWY82_07345 [Simiduia curdlanivorans]|uniref:Uncharacterized protein n=1 Tax=Simiduia curdlanivorans TaxID=1492769 RepID=A0ABV8V5S0_9GAMM|nr:hypothetical protein [Simiduia curdlanivorans]MDN3638616.1 hypothetical protein [Simiduia curdlanivorans]
MKTPLKTLLFSCWVIFAATQSVNSLAQSTTGSGTLGCPEGFAPIPSGLACAAVNLTGDISWDIPPGTDCPKGFERPAGVRFCIASNLSLDVQDDTLLISKFVGSDCGPGFSRAPGTTICTADNLVLDLVDNEVKLARFTGDCPRGFHRPLGSRFCVAENLTLKTLSAPPSQDCPPGFIRPAGVHFCIASNMLFADEGRLNDLPPPQGICPEGWTKPRNVNFCVPKNIASACGRECGTDFATIAIKPAYEGDELAPCPAGSVEIWWDMPVYDEQGLFVVGHTATRTCIPESLDPAG